MEKTAHKERGFCSPVRSLRTAGPDLTEQRDRIHMLHLCTNKVNYTKTFIIQYQTMGIQNKMQHQFLA